MSRPAAPHPAKLVIGFFMPAKGPDEAVTTALVEQFGPPDVVSAWLPFNYTDYYTPEMGQPLFRRMLAFERLIEQDHLASVKLATNALEDALTQDGRRQVNVDPGYMLRERFVLATGKNFSHRIYVGQGIYADLTLIYRRGHFEALPWTYPDYRAEDMQMFLMRVRNKFVIDSKHLQPRVQPRPAQQAQAARGDTR